MSLIIIALAVSIVLGLLVLAALAPEALTPPRWARAAWRLADEYLRNQLVADRSTNWNLGELTSIPQATDIQRTVPVAEVLGAFMPRLYNTPGAHRLGGHHDRAPYGTVTGSYAQVARWQQDTTALPVVRELVDA